MTPASASQRLMVLNKLAGQLMLFQQVAEIHDGGAVRQALSRDNQANRRNGGDFVQSIFHRAIAQVAPMPYAVNAAAWFSNG